MILDVWMYVHTIRYRVSLVTNDSCVYTLGLGGGGGRQVVEKKQHKN